MPKQIVWFIMVILLFNGACTILSQHVSETTAKEKLLVQASTGSNNINYDLVIISPEQFTSSLQSLANHKNNIGTKTIIKTLEELYNEYTGRDQPEQIKYFIKDAVEKWNVTSVLLVGGSNLVPSRHTHIFYDDFPEFSTPSEWIFLSDLYYADIYDYNGMFSSWDTNENNVFAEYNWQGNTDIIDLKPDVYLGRLPCTNENELQTCINKIITYENNTAYTQDWFHNIVLIGGDSLPGDDAAIDEGEYVNEQVVNIMEGFTPIKIWASNGALNDASNIQNAINGGAGFVFFNGHGNLDLWATHPHENNRVWIPQGMYTNTHINSLSNNHKLPIVISDACYHCAYGTKSDCFGWSFVTNPIGGSIAFIGGSDMDLSYGGEAIITKGVEKLCLEIAKWYTTGATTLGEMLGKSISSYISTATMDEIDRIVIMENHLFGDPTLLIAEQSNPPEKPAPPTGPSSGKINEVYTYQAITTDPDNDMLFYKFQWGDGRYSDWQGPYEPGETCTITNTWDKRGSFEIRVIAKDNHGVTSEWSDPLSISMPKNNERPLIELCNKIISQILLFFNRTTG